MRNGWFVVGIAGATCSGKTTVAQRLKKNIKNSVLINQDEYFHDAEDPRHVRVPEVNHINFELMTSMDMPRMIADIERTIATPANDIQDDPPKPRVLILDGFLIFNCSEIVQLCDARYFLDLTKEQCWERRRTRVYDPPDVPNYFEKVVWPEYVESKSEILRDKALAVTITFVDGARSKEDVFSEVFDDIKKRISL